MYTVQLIMYKFAMDVMVTVKNIAHGSFFFLVTLCNDAIECAEVQECLMTWERQGHQAAAHTLMESQTVDSH